MSRLGVLLGHLLKWDLQPDRRSRSWFCGIREQRRGIQRLLSQNPSLRAKATAALNDGSETGVDLMLRETDLPLRALPAVSPWSLEQALDPAMLCDTRGDWGEGGGEPMVACGDEAVKRCVGRVRGGSADGDQKGRSVDGSAEAKARGVEPDFDIAKLLPTPGQQ